MQENDPAGPEPTANHSDDPASAGTPTRRPLRRRLAGRAPYVAAGLAAVIGLGFAGVSATTGDAGEPDRSAAVADAADRSRAAHRADRSERDPAGTGGPTITPATSAATPAASTGAGKPTPRAKPSAAGRTTRPPTKRPPSWVNPMPGAETTSCFGMRWGALHAGIDLAMPANTAIRAAGAGTVVEAGWAYAGYGISVVIDHGNGYLTHYAHQNRAAVRVGQRVAAGDLIGYEGSTGDSTGPHLHFEVHRGLWNQLDPAGWMRARGVDLGC